MRIRRIPLITAAMLAGAPLLHGAIFWGNPFALARDRLAEGIFLLYGGPAWATVIVVFVLEALRGPGENPPTARRFGLRLGLFGLVAPAVGIALSPIAADLDLPAFAFICLSGFGIGLVAGTLFRLAAYR